MAHQPIGENIVEPLIPKNDDFVKFAKGVLWFVSLTAAITSHHSFKSTNFYKHFNLQRFDHELLVPIAIISLHAVFAFLTRVTHLIDMRGANEAHRFVRIMEAQLQLQGMLLLVLNEQLLNDGAMITTATMFPIFFMSFFRLVAPGFGWKVPIISVFVALLAAYRVSRLLEFAPIFFIIFLVTSMPSPPEHNERHVGRQKQMHSQTGS